MAALGTRRRVGNDAGSARTVVLTGLSMLVLGAAAGLSAGYLVWGMDAVSPSGGRAFEDGPAPSAAPHNSAASLPADTAKGNDNAEWTQHEGDASAASSQTVEEPPAAVHEDAMPPTDASSLTFAQLDAEADLWPARRLILGFEGVTLVPETAQLLEGFKPGGVLLRAQNLAGPEQSVDLVKAVRAAVGLGSARGALPLIVLDPESAGPALGLKKAPTFRELATGNNLDFARQAGVAWGAVCRETGIDAVLAPPLDVYRDGAHARWELETFSADPRAVAAFGLAFAEGLMSEGVLPVGGHFPGHGAAREDSRFERAILTGNAAEAVRHLLPFNEAARGGLPALLTGHIAVPALNPAAPAEPASLSAALTEEFLRRRWGYEGVVIADDLASPAAGKPVPEAFVEALAAGHDAAIVAGTDKAALDAAARAVETAVEAGRLNRSSLAQSVHRLDGLMSWLREPAPLPGPVPPLPPQAHTTHATATSESAAGARNTLSNAGRPAATPQAATAIHVVTRGETWYGLAESHGTTMQALLELNGLEDGAVLMVDQRIRVPAQEE